MHGAEAGEIEGQGEEVGGAATEMVLAHGGGVVAVVRVPPQPQQLLVQLLEVGHHFVAGAVDEDLPGRSAVGHAFIFHHYRNAVLEIPHSGHCCRSTT